MPARTVGHAILRGLRAEIDACQSAVEEAMAQHGYGREALFAVRLALEEALVNAIRHGNRHVPGGQVDFRWSVDGDEARFEVRDQGDGFDPDAVPDPTHDDNLEIPSGRGIMLMKAYMSEVAYRDPGNHVSMVYRRSKDA
ncbi:MAG: ATP-binding protein [Planctomycetes bacterium]|nr:ATP-binding protein [Planctomycetota bacterium]